MLARVSHRVFFCRIRDNLSNLLMTFCWLQYNDSQSNNEAIGKCVNMVEEILNQSYSEQNRLRINDDDDDDDEVRVHTLLVWQQLIISVYCRRDQTMPTRNNLLLTTIALVTTPPPPPPLTMALAVAVVIITVAAWITSV